MTARLSTPWIPLVFCSLLFACGDEAPIAGPDDSGSGPPSRRSGSANTVLVLGTSLSAGYRINPEQAYPALLQEKIDALGWDFEVVNAGVSGDTVSSGLQRLDWLLKNDLAVLVVELGANDGLRGHPADLVREKLQAIVDRTRSRHPAADIVLVGMQAPPNMGPDYCDAFRALYPQLAEANDLPLVPFLLEGIGGEPDLNLPDGIHPNEDGHEVIVETVWAVLEEVLRARVESS